MDNRQIFGVFFLLQKQIFLFYHNDAFRHFLKSLFMYRIPSWLCRSLRSQRIIWDRCWTKSHIPFFFHTPPPHIPLHLYIFLGKTHNWSHTNVCLSVCTVTLSHHNKSSPNSLLVVIPLPTLHSLFLALSLWHSPKSCTHMHSITYILKSASVIYHIVLLIEFANFLNVTKQCTL